MIGTNNQEEYLGVDQGSLSEGEKKTNANILEIGKQTKRDSDDILGLRNLKSSDESDDFGYNDLFEFYKENKEKSYTINQLVKILFIFYKKRDIDISHKNIKELLLLNKSSNNDRITLEVVDGFFGKGVNIIVNGKWNGICLDKYGNRKSGSRFSYI